MTRLSQRSAPALGALVVTALLVAAPHGEAASAAGRSAVATENQTATREALAQLAAGGNAIDAAVTAALVGGVTSPVSSGIAGGGFVLVWLAADQKPFCLDFRETAPPAFESAPFESRPFKPEERGRYVGTPGEVKGLFELHRRFGKRKWSDVVAPAARWAKLGYPVSRHLATSIGGVTTELQRDAGLTAVFFPGGKAAAVGALVTNPKLAATLDKIAAAGPAALYEGEVAADLVATASAAHGALSLEALRAYQPVERTPLHVTWEGHDVYTMPPPSAGGLMLIETLSVLSRAELRRLGLGTAAYTHLLGELMRGAVADRMRYLSDPDAQAVDLTMLLDPKRLAERRRRIALDRTHTLPRFGLEEHGTHQIVTADAGGNFVSLTTTVNRAFGARLMGAQSGALLNDQLDDFTATADVAPFDLTESPNRARAGARPVSSMAPTLIVSGGKVELAIGGSGGTAIASNVTQLVISRLAFGTAPLSLVGGPRFYVPTKGATITLDPGASPDFIADLEARGEIVKPQAFLTSGVQLIAVERGFKVPASDPRKGGSAAAR